MRKFVAGMAVGILVIGLGVRFSGGQESETTRMSAGNVMQGGIVNMDVTVNRAPSLDGRIYVRVGPEGGNDQLTLLCNLNTGAAMCEAGERMPLDAKLGKWTIRKITFQPLASSPEKELTTSGDVSFQVTPHGEVVLPDSATVSEIK
ncbi:MAG: hypothetical protein WA020_13910 [Candidatus Acidiferrales bacterium]